MAVALSITSVSCMDLGVGEREDSFRDYFDEVVLLSRQGRQEVDIDRFYSPISMGDDIDDVVNYEEYCYVGFKTAKTIEVDEFAFHAKSQAGEGGRLLLEFYVADGIPDDIEKSDDELLINPDKEYDEAGRLENRYFEAVFNVRTDWNSVLLDFGKNVKIAKGDYIVVKIRNNCVDETEEIKHVEFTLNYLLFHFVSVE